MAGLAVGIISSGRKTDIRWSLTLPMLSINGPVGMNIGWIVAVSDKNNPKPVGVDRADNRTKVVEKAISAGFEYLCFIDDDTCCPNFALKYLHFQLANNLNAMICGGIYCTKEDMPSPLVFKEIGGGPFWQWKIGDVFECQGLGLGCTMIKTEVFKSISQPWFFEPHETPIDQTIRVGTEDMSLGHREGTDDLYFCKKVTDAGFKILAHGGVLPVHLDQDGKMYTLPMDSYPVQGSNLKALEQ
jgi:hypothetical protein